MSFSRHREIFQSDVIRSDREQLRHCPRPHRLDAFPIGYSSAGCSPTEPASASPTVDHSALQSSCRSILFNRTVNSVLTACLSQGDHPNYTLQITYNSRLKPTHVWAGDIIDAHHAGVRVAAKTYSTPTYKDADIVVANAYPQNAQAFHGALWINYAVREGGTGVVIVQSPLGIDPVHYLNNRLAGKNGVTQFDLTTRRRTGNGRRPPKYANLIVYSQYLTRNMQDNYKTGTIFCNRWEDVISKLRDLHPGDPKIAVYPYAGMQHQEIELDG